jgi:hypothetical protein
MMLSRDEWARTRAARFTDAISCAHCGQMFEAPHDFYLHFDAKHQRGVSRNRSGDAATSAVDSARVDGSVVPAASGTAHDADVTCRRCGHHEATPTSGWCRACLRTEERRRRQCRPGGPIVAVLKPGEVYVPDTPMFEVHADSGAALVLDVAGELVEVGDALDWSDSAIEEAFGNRVAWLRGVIRNGSRDERVCGVNSRRPDPPLTPERNDGAETASVPDGSWCLWCGGPMPEFKRGRKVRTESHYCCNAHKQAAYRQRQRQGVSTP